MDILSSLRHRNPSVLVHQIGGRIRRQRLAKGMTQAELAERAGVSISTLKLLEHQGKGSLQRLAKIAVVLDLDGDLRSLFSNPRSYGSIEEVERMSRKRAPQRRKHPTESREL